MTYQEVQPDSPLAPFVQCFWASESGETDAAHTILPDGCFDLIADVEAGKIIGLKLTGIWSIPIHVHSRARQRRLAVRFRPLAAELLADIARWSLSQHHLHREGLEAHVAMKKHTETLGYSAFTAGFKCLFAFARLHEA